MVTSVAGDPREGAVVRVGQLQLTGELADKCDPYATPCVFALDNSRVAWACGQRRVVILTWNGHKQCLVRDNVRDNSGATLPDRELVIATGHDVCAMSFWMGCRRRCDVRRGSWKRFDFTQTPILATGHPNGRIRLWSLESGALLLELMDHRGAVRDLQFAPDDSLRLLSASSDKTLKAWDLTDDGNMYKTMSECRVPLLRCAWRPDGLQLVACGRSKMLYVFDMVANKLMRKLEGHRHEISSCCFSHDGRLIVSSSLDTRAIVWDADTGSQLRTLAHLDPPPRLIFASGENGAWVKAAALSPNMCQLATVCEDGHVRFWHVWQDSCEPVVSLLVPQVREDEMLVSCSFNAAGSVVVVGTSHGNAYFFTTPRHVPSLAHLARRTVRCLTSVGDLEQLFLPATIRAYLCYE